MFQPDLNESLKLRRPVAPAVFTRRLTVSSNQIFGRAGLTVVHVRGEHVVRHRFEIAQWEAHNLHVNRGKGGKRRAMNCTISIIGLVLSSLFVSGQIVFGNRHRTGIRRSVTRVMRMTIKPGCRCFVLVENDRAILCIGADLHRRHDQKGQHHQDLQRS
jgi:hypothetical protein